MKETKILDEIRELHIAMDLISFGARIQVLESETSLSRRKILRLYKEIKGDSPPKGMLPFSEDWFMSWEQNIHASCFYNIYLFLYKVEASRQIERVIKSYKLYMEQFSIQPNEKIVLSLTRAWTLLRFVDCGIMVTTNCCVCGGRFVTISENAKKTFICSLCNPPSRAVKKINHLNRLDLIAKV